MRFLVDAQLPYRLVNALAERGHDTIHTLDLPDGNITSDHEVPLLLTVEEAGELLRIGRTKAYAMTRGGEKPTAAPGWR